jgi:hypothetical protein
MLDDTYCVVIPAEVEAVNLTLGSNPSPLHLFIVIVYCAWMYMWS